MLDSQKHIMVVEDDTELNSLLCALLRSVGYSADAVFDGEQAMRTVDSARPDAIVLDIMLPGMNGFDVCRKLKFRRQTNGIPIVMLTAMDSQESRHNGLRVGANRYVTKPFNPDHLFEELRNVLDHCPIAPHARASVDFEMTSDSRRFEQLNELLAELFIQTDLPELEIDKMRQAVLEMIENAREWGNKGRADLIVSVSYELTDHELKFVITDQGSGFDPDNLPHAARDDDPIAHIEVRANLGLRYGGFGMMIARGVMDEVVYNEKGNQVTLIKWLKPEHVH